MAVENKTWQARLIIEDELRKWKRLRLYIPSICPDKPWCFVWSAALSFDKAVNKDWIICSTCLYLSTHIRKWCSTICIAKRLFPLFTVCSFFWTFLNVGSSIHQFCFIYIYLTRTITIKRNRTRRNLRAKHILNCLISLIEKRKLCLGQNPFTFAMSSAMKLLS